MRIPIPAKFVFIVALALVNTNLFASDKDGSFAIKGIGALTCSQFTELKERDDSAMLQFGGWMNGYLSGLNESTNNTFDLIDFENSDTLIAYVNKYCESYPEHRFLFAVKAIVKSLSPIRVTHNNDPLVTFKGEQTVLLYPQTVDWIVVELSKLGYLENATKTPSTPQISEALAKYQQDKGLPISGQPTQHTLVKLLRVGK